MNPSPHAAASSRTVPASTPSAATAPPRFPLYRFPWTIFWTALIVRVVYMTVAHTYRIRPYMDHFDFGYEMARIARALVTGYGYSDPFWGHTGPTAWTGPVYPLIIAAVFHFFGIYTAASAWVLLAFNSVCSAAITRPLHETATRLFGSRVALWTAWIWALYPAAMQYAVRWVWEMSVTALLFQWVLCVALRTRGLGNQPGDGSTTQRWAGFGLLWGLIALSNSSLCAFAPLCGLWMAWRPGSEGKTGRFSGKALVGAVLSGVLCLAVITPWAWRNWLVFHQFVPLRGNLGTELYLGNGPGSNGLLMEYDHPFQAPDQLRLYTKMGEIDYSRMRAGLAKAYMRAHPGHFVADVGKRMYYFWAGVPHPTDEKPWNEYGRQLNFGFTSLAGLGGLLLALRRRRPGAGLLAMAFVVIPGIYYLVTVHARFRHPLEPLIAMLAVYLFKSAEPRRSLQA